MVQSESGSSPGHVTRVLAEVSRGDPEAQTRLLLAIYDELKRIAGAKLARAGPRPTLQPTALVHEAYLRIFGGAPGARDFRDRNHFFSAAAAAMRSILVDHARRNAARGRGGTAAARALDDEPAGASAPFGHIVEVHEALERLGANHARAARVVELLFFGGLSVEEAASVLGVSDRTVKRDWRFGRAWLMRELGEV